MDGSHRCRSRRGADGCHRLRFRDAATSTQPNPLATITLRMQVINAKLDKIQAELNTMRAQSMTGRLPYAAAIGAVPAPEHRNNGDPHAQQK